MAEPLDTGADFADWRERYRRQRVPESVAASLHQRYAEHAGQGGLGWQRWWPALPVGSLGALLLGTLLVLEVAPTKRPPREVAATPVASHANESAPARVWSTSISSGVRGVSLGALQTPTSPSAIPTLSELRAPRLSMSTPRL